MKRRQIGATVTDDTERDLNWLTSLVTGVSQPLYLHIDMQLYTDNHVWHDGELLVPVRTVMLQCTRCRCASVLFLSVNGDADFNNRGGIEAGFQKALTCVNHHTEDIFTGSACPSPALNVHCNSGFLPRSAVEFNVNSTSGRIKPSCVCVRDKSSHPITAGESEWVAARRHLR